MDSVSTAPAQRVPIMQADDGEMGMRALPRAWRQITIRSLCTLGGPSGCSPAAPPQQLDRVILVMTARGLQARVWVGSTRSPGVEARRRNHRSFTEKSSISRTPAEDGRDSPTMARKRVTLSKRLFWRWRKECDGHSKDDGGDNAAQGQFQRRGKALLISLATTAWSCDRPISPW